MLAIAVISIATPALADPAPPPPAAVGALIGPALHVRDLDRSLRFYVDGLDMTKALQMGPPERRETILTFGADPRNAGIILLTGKAAQEHTSPRPGSGYDRTVIRMRDLDATSSRLNKAGFVASPIRDVAQGYRMMTAVDPDGFLYELVQSGAASQPAR